jgi:hypothetical protein
MSTLVESSVTVSFGDVTAGISQLVTGMAIFFPVHIVSEAWVHPAGTDPNEMIMPFGFPIAANFSGPWREDWPVE